VTGQHSNQLNYRSALTYSPKTLVNKKRGEYSNYDPRETLILRTPTKAFLYTPYKAATTD
jgi:hypothetical protein